MLTNALRRSTLYGVSGDFLPKKIKPPLAEANEGHITARGGLFTQGQ